MFFSDWATVFGDRISVRDIAGIPGVERQSLNDAEKKNSTDSRTHNHG